MRVPFAKRILPVLLALIWAPLAVHCPLEALTQWELLSCTTATPAQDSPAHCGDETCLDVESGLYHLPPDQLLITQVLTVVPVFAQIVFESVEAAVTFVEVPPDGPRPWQFVVRAALPVRAPSVIS
jgi:hypothetical protein